MVTEAARPHGGLKLGIGTHSPTVPKGSHITRASPAPNPATHSHTCITLGTLVLLEDEEREVKKRNPESFERPVDSVVQWPLLKL